MLLVLLFNDIISLQRAKIQQPSWHQTIPTTQRFAVSVRWEREQRERRRQASNSSGPVITKQPIFTYTIEDFHRYFCCCARRVGTMFFLLEKRDGTPIVVAGPCWPFCTFVTVPLIVVLSGLVVYFILLDPMIGLVSMIMVTNWCFSTFN